MGTKISLMKSKSFEKEANIDNNKDKTPQKGKKEKKFETSRILGSVSNSIESIAVNNNNEKDK